MVPPRRSGGQERYLDRSLPEKISADPLAKVVAWALEHLHEQFDMEGGRLLFCSPTKPGSCADITHARELGLVKLLAGGPAVEILAQAGCQGPGAQTGGRVVTPPHRKFKKNAPDWYEEMHERRRKAHSSRRIRVEHGIAHLKNWPALTRHLGRREHMDDTVQAIAGLLSQQQTADRIPAWQT